MKQNFQAVLKNHQYKVRLASKAEFFINPRCKWRRGVGLSRRGTSSGGERGDGCIISDRPGGEGSEKVGEVRPAGSR